MGKSFIPSFDRGLPVRWSCLAAFYARFFAARLVLLVERKFIFIDATALGERAYASERSMVGTDFSIPVFFFEGTEDFMAPIEPAYAYFEEVKAPRKEFVLFKGGDHFIPLDRPDEFLTQLIEYIRPLVF